MIQTLFGSVQQEPNLLERLKAGIEKTRSGLVDRLEDAFAGRKEIDADLLEELEYALITADIGVNTATEILESIRERADRKQLGNAGEVKQLIAQHLLEVLEATDRPLPHVAEPPAVVMVVGVNGSGKTTTIGKLANRYQVRRAQRAAVRRRYVSRRGHRAAAGLGRAHWNRRDPAVRGRRPERRAVRRAAGRQSAQSGLRHRRHRRPAAHQIESDGGAGKNAPHRRQGDSHGAA